MAWVNYEVESMTTLAKKYHDEATQYVADPKSATLALLSIAQALMAIAATQAEILDLARSQDARRQGDY